MSEWKEYKISDIGTVKGGKRLPKGKMLVTTRTNHPYIRIRDLNQIKVLELNNEFEYVDDDTQKEICRYIVDEGDVLISIVGTIGLVNIVGKSLNKANLTENCVRITNLKEIYNDYLYYYLVSTKGQNEIKRGTVGAVQPKLPIYNIQDITIYAPELASQQRIASILSSLDDKIAVNKKICENLEAQAQALFKHWFVDFAPFKDGNFCANREQNETCFNSAEVQPKITGKACKFVESELGLIPEGWRVGTLSDLGEIVGGATPSKAESSYFTDKGIPWLTPKDLSNDLKKFTSRGEIDITEEGYNSCSAKIMPRGSVLFSSRAPIGYLTIAKNNICTNQGFKSVVPKYAGTAYIYYLLKLNTKRIESMSSGTTFKEASGALMKSLAVSLPPKSILDAFESQVLDIFNEQEILETECSRLATLRDTLLPKLMSGQIKVNEIEKSL